MIRLLFYVSFIAVGAVMLASAIAAIAAHIQESNFREWRKNQLKEARDMKKRYAAHKEAGYDLILKNQN